MLLTLEYWNNVLSKKPIDRARSQVENKAEYRTVLAQLFSWLLENTDIWELLLLEK